MGKRLLTLPDTTVKESNEVDLCSDLRRRAKYLQTLSVHLWNRFRRKYLLSLQGNYKGVLKWATLWCTGGVQNLLKGNYGYAKGAVVRVGEKGKKNLLHTVGLCRDYTPWRCRTLRQ